MSRLMMKANVAVLALLLLGPLMGCISSYPLSNEVRAGGTVMLPLGASEGADKLLVSDLVATVTDSLGTDHIAKIRRVLRVYGDATSRFGRGVPGNSNHSEMYYQGQWLAIIDFVDTLGVALPMATGAATLALTENGQVVGVTMNLEILPGTTTTNPLATTGHPLISWLDYASTERHAALRIVGAPASRVRGMSFKLHYNPIWFAQDVFVGKATSDPNMQLSWHSYDVGAGLKGIDIQLSNPHGFDVPVKPPGGYPTLDRWKSMERDLSSVVISWDSGVVSSQANLDYAMTLQDAVFWDESGNELNDLTVWLEYMQ